MAPLPATHATTDPLVLRGLNLSVRIQVLKPGFVLVSALGEVAIDEDARVESELLEELDRQLERAGRLTLFVDLRESPRMPAASRENIARWLRRHQARLLPSHALVASTWLERALLTIAMLIGGNLFKIHRRPEVFLALLRKVSPKMSELPKVCDR